MTKRESSLSRKLRHFAYSTESKIFARSRGLDSSVQLLQTEQLGAGGRDKRREGARGDVRDQTERLDIVRVIAPFVVADQRAIRLAARRSELVFVDLLPQLALVELDGPGQIAQQLALRQIEHAQLEGGSGLAVHDEIVQAPPAAFELQKARVVHDLVELGRQRGVDRRDRLLDRAREVAVERDRAGQRLLDQRLDEFLGAVRLGLLGRRNDLIEKSGDRSGFSGGGGGRGGKIGNCSALLFGDAKFA